MNWPSPPMAMSTRPVSLFTFSTGSVEKFSYKSLLDNIIAISIIDAPDYNAFGQCTFYTNGEKTLVSQITESGLQQVVVGPPQPITGVSCSGVCIPTYGECFGIDGQSKGSCCSGFCAGTRCRPWAQ